MNKKEFTNILGNQLNKIRKDEYNKFLHYYDELIEDYKENGLDEAQAVAKVGDPFKIAEEILEGFSEDNLEMLYKERKSIKSIYNIAMSVLYGIALLACFICNLAIDGKLSWFFVVLGSIAVSFSITNLPLFIKKYKIFISALYATVLIFLLLVICNIYLQYNINWLRNTAFPIFICCIIPVWLIIGVIYFKTNKLFKSSLIVLIAGVADVVVNNYCSWIIYGTRYSFSMYFDARKWDSKILSEIIVVICCFLYFAITSMVSLILESNKKKDLHNFRN